MNLGMEGKTALVLAASGGLGQMIAIALAREGAALAVTGRKEEALARTVAQVSALGVRTISESLDLIDLASLTSFVGRIDRELGGVDILVNISGGPPPTTAANVTPEQWMKEFKSMVLPIMHVTDLVLPGMRAKRWGRIITSTSSGVVAPIAHLGISNTLRSSLVGWSKTLAREVAAEGITVNMVVPGRIATPRIQQLDQARAEREGKTLDEVLKQSTASIPLQRYGTPEEFASVVAFLASTNASYITGSMLRVDGGMIQSA